MRRTGKRRCRAAAIPCCGEKRTLSRTGAGQKALLFEVPRQRLMFRTGTGQSRAGSRSATCEKTPRARGRNHFPLLRRLRRAKNAPRMENRTERRPPLEAFPGAGRRQKALSFCHHFFLHRTLTIRYIAPDIISTRPLIK